MKNNQKGFGAVEALLFLILVSILGFTGYYVYHTRSNTSATYNSSAKLSSSTPTDTATNKFVFKELGVQFELPSDLKGLKYTIQHFSDGDSAYLTTPSFKAVNEKCYGQSDNGDGPSFAAIGKSNGTFDQSQQIEAGLLKQFPNFYLSISYPNGITVGCKTDPNDDSVQLAAHKYQVAFMNAFKATATEVK